MPCVAAVDSAVFKHDLLRALLWGKYCIRLLHPQVLSGWLNVETEWEFVGTGSPGGAPWCILEK